MLFVFIHVYWCLTLFPCKMMFVCCLYKGPSLIDVICIYLLILVFNTIYISDDVCLLFVWGSISYLCYLYSFTRTGVQHDLYIRWCSFVVCMRVHLLFMLFVFIYSYWCPTRFIYQMMFVCCLYEDPSLIFVIHFIISTIFLL